MLPTLSSQTVVLFLLVFSRIASLVATLPITGSSDVPATIRAGLAFFMSVIVVFFAGTKYHPVPEGVGPVALACAGEVFVGLLMGFSVMAVMEAVNLAGNMIGFQMGLTIANVIDPNTGAQISIIANYQTLLAGMIFLVSGLYQKFVAGIIRSFEILGPGMVTVRFGGMKEFITMGGEIFSQAVSIGAPLIVVLLLANVGMGLMARTFPQMNVFFIGFPVTIGLGLLFLALSTPFVFSAIVYCLEGSERHFWALLRASMPG